MLILLTFASILGAVKSAGFTILAVANAILALIATISVWKTYLVIGTKILLTLLIFIPIVGILIFLFWGQRKVRAAQTP